MRPQLLTNVITALFPIGRTLCIEGAPGGGKTTLVQQAAKKLGVHYIERHMPTMLVEDFGVLYPDATSDALHYKLPDWFPAVGSKWDDGKGGILCFDDRNQAGADLQKVLANICQARTLHGTPLAKGWMVVSTGNRQSDKAGANRVLSHLRNRETVVEFETHLDDWTAWAADNGVRPEVMAFIRFRPGLLHDFDPQRDANPTPRSWVEGVGALLGSIPYEAEYECFKGAVGEGAAAEFTGFMKIYRELPDPDVMLASPDTVIMPKEPATLYALTGALSERVEAKLMDNFVKLLGKMPPEFSVLAMSITAKRKPEVTSTKAFGEWAIANQSVLF